MQAETLFETLARLPDPRARNRSHPLPAILALAVCAMLCGRTSMLGIAEWGRSHGKEVAKALGFRRQQTPCVATLCKVFRVIDAAAFEAILGAWFTARMSRPTNQRPILAVDGKTLRGSQGHGEIPGVALVAAFAVALGVVVDQERVTNGDELGAVRRLLERLPLEGVIVTGDALQTQRDVCELIVKKKATTSSRPRTTNPPSSTRSTRRSPRTPRLVRPASKASEATATKSARSR
jgi:hypothetical protein